MILTSGSKYNSSPNIKTRSYNKSKPLLKCSKVTTNKNSPCLNKSIVNNTVTNSTNSEVKTPNNRSDKSIQKLNKNSTTYNSVAVGTEGKIHFITSLLYNEWLSDDSIQIYFDIINNKLLKKYPISIVNPVIVQAAKCLIDIDYIVQPLGLDKQDIIFLPINDSDSMKLETGGSHWSLLVFIKAQHVFYYFDSIDNYNLLHAQNVANKLKKYIDPQSTTDIEVIPQYTPQQTNSFDCGIYMIMIVEIIISKALKVNLKIDDMDHFLTLPDWGELEVWTKRAQLASIVFNSETRCSQIDNIVTMLVTSAANSKYQDNEKEPSVSDTDLQNKINSLEGKIQSYKETLSVQNTELLSLKNASTNHYNAEGNIKTLSKWSNKLNKKPKSLTPDKNMKSSKVFPKLSLSCDSQGRGLALELGLISDKYTLFNCVQPGAPMEAVMSSITESGDLQGYTKKDYIVVIGGSNNIHGKNPYFLSQLSSYLEKQLVLFSHTNLILATVPYRYDLRQESDENKIIQELNYIIRNLAYKYDHVFLLDLYLLQSCHHTRHGMHIGKRGKKFVSRGIINIITKRNFQLNSTVTNSCKTKTDAETVTQDVLLEALHRNTMNDGVGDRTSSELLSARKLTETVTPCLKLPGATVSSPRSVSSPWKGWPTPVHAATQMVNRILGSPQHTSPCMILPEVRNCMETSASHTKQAGDTEQCTIRGFDCSTTDACGMNFTSELGGKDSSSGNYFLSHPTTPP